MSAQCYGNLNIIIFLCQSLLFCFLSRNVSKTTKSIFTESSWVTQEDRVEALNVNGNALERKDTARSFLVRSEILQGKEIEAEAFVVLRVSSAAWWKMWKRNIKHKICYSSWCSSSHHDARLSSGSQLSCDPSKRCGWTTRLLATVSSLASHVNALPALHGISAKPSGRLPSSWVTEVGRLLSCRDACIGQRA